MKKHKKIIKMKNLFLTLGLFLSIVVVNAQEQNVIGSAGEQSSTGNIQVSWTVGETVTQTASNNNAVVTQGFHQTNLTVTQIDEKSVNNSDLNLQIYPNPTVDKVTVSVEGDNIPALMMKLSDNNGKTLQDSKLEPNQKVDFSNYAEGVYYLTTYTKDNNFSKVFKIIKAKK